MDIAKELEELNGLYAKALEADRAFRMADGLYKDKLKIIMSEFGYKEGESIPLSEALQKAYLKGKS